MLRADVAQISERDAIAGEQQVIAVVDLHAERGIVVGTAAAAGKGRGFVYDDALAVPGKLERSGQASKSGADDVDGSQHQRRLQSTRKSNFARDRRTRRRGGAKPRASSASRMAR